ncbi:MAG: hypothetical protein Q7T80_00900 [Methanoregula sp.]|nr:hypothetical protein [Methanoregula sp.]
MDSNKPLMGVLCSIVPGLGQVYGGRNLRGLLLGLGVFFSGILAILALLGYAGSLVMIGEYLLLIPLAIWIYAAFDAYTLCRKMVAGEIPAYEPQALHMILFVVGAAILVGICVVIAGVAVVMLALGGAGNYEKMHDSPGVNVTIRAERAGSDITLTNIDGGYSGLSSYAVYVNGQPANQTLGAEKGSEVILNGTAATDHVIVKGFWNYGASQTLLDTYV